MVGGREKEQDGRDKDRAFLSFLSCSNEEFLTMHQQIKSADSPITRIFGGKFRSTLRAPLQKDSVIVEDWRALRLDIQVCATFPATFRFYLPKSNLSATISTPSRMPFLICPTRSQCR